MLRNMVTSLIEHEQIKTTYAKAKEARKMADQIIGWGKKAGPDNETRARASLMVGLKVFPQGDLSRLILPLHSLGRFDRTTT